MKSVFLEIDPDQPMPAAPGKSCGFCTACCYTVPVKEIGVRAFQRCPKLHDAFQMKIGCSIYPDRPCSCLLWSCSWLLGALPDRFRPDRLGIVMDPLPDVARIAGKEVPAAQFWVIPGHEEDWQIDDVGELIWEIVSKGMVVLWRMKDPDGGQLSRAFGCIDGCRYITPVEKSREQLSGFENEVDRFRHAQKMLRNTR